jgi:SNF2 family DNA or RNA helicase
MTHYLGDGVRKHAERAKTQKKKKRASKMITDFCSTGGDEMNMSDAESTASSLEVSNVLLDSQKMANAPDVPTFSAVQTNPALTQMLSSFLEAKRRSKEEKESAKGDKKKLSRALRHFSRNNKPKPVLVDGVNGWLAPRMNTPLRNHQLIGTGFLRERETSTEEPRGGLLADGMGLGKTIQMLANIVDGLPSRAARKHGMTITLIVLPPSLVKQWMSEIEKHCKNTGKVIVFDAKVRQSIPLEMLKLFDIM